METSRTQWRFIKNLPSWRPPTDIYETGEKIIVRIEIAGMHEEDFSIQLNGRKLSIRGVRPDIAEQRAYHQMEIRFGEFTLDVEIPTPVAADQIEAIYMNGFLQIFLPKLTPRQIQIR